MQKRRRLPPHSKSLSAARHPADSARAGTSDTSEQRVRVSRGCEPAKLGPVAMPADVRAQAEAALADFCAEHSSAPGADRLRYVYQIEANAAVLSEQRPGFMNPDDWVSRPIAKLRYSEARNTWTLYWSDANGKWHRVSDAKAEADIRAALQFVISDPLGVFWS